MKRLCLYGVLLLLLPLGAIAAKRYEIPCNGLLLKEAVAIMYSQVGICEATSRNDGEVNKYTQSLGLRGNCAYCAAGLWWCFEQARQKLGLPANSHPLPATAVANEMFDFAMKHGKQTNYVPGVYDLIVWKRQNSFRGHIECVVEVLAAGFVRTIAFNSSSVVASKRCEGVFLQKRNVFHPLSRMKVRGLIGFRVV